VRKVNQEITDKGIIEEILSNAQICRIAMLDNDRPYLLPFNYGYRDNCIFVHSAKEGKKIELLRKNNLVCFEIEQMVQIIKHEKACKWSTLYRSVVGYGYVEIIADFERKIQGLQIIMAQHGAPETNDFDRRHVDAVVILKLTIDTITGKQSGNWNRLNQD
jgi:nitroimidazol reductase NimA-like FMN-containing flavoprotein (pyridoxamine 5'-phosphate oxidase superfamily)